MTGQRVEEQRTPLKQLALSVNVNVTLERDPNTSFLSRFNKGVWVNMCVKTCELPAGQLTSSFYSLWSNNKRLERGSLQFHWWLAVMINSVQSKIICLFFLFLSDIVLCCHTPSWVVPLNSKLFNN